MSAGSRDTVREVRPLTHEEAHALAAWHRLDDVLRDPHATDWARQAAAGVFVRAVADCPHILELVRRHDPDEQETEP